MPVRPPVVLAAVVALAATYVAWHLGRGWIPNDDGSLAHAAERVMQGELPHRDFDDIYTGGLAVLNAAAFRVFGTNLWSLRLALFASFLLWVPATYAVARRFAAPLAAAGITLLSVVWSVPNYPAAMPSWYNLFFATFGLLAVFRHLEDARARWLFAAGMAGGLSCLVKVVGLYYVSGVLLFLVFHEQERARRMSSVARAPVYATLVSLALVMHVLALVALIRTQPRAAELAHFVLPSAALAALIAKQSWQANGSDRERLIALARVAAPFLTGVAVPIVAFLVPYARSGALGAFVQGVFVLPTKRLGVTAATLPPLWTSLFAAGPAALLLLGDRQFSTRGKRGALTVVLAAAVAAAGSVAWIYRATWYSVRSLVPILVVGGVAVLWRRRAADDVEPQRRERTMLLLCATAMCSLVQYPFAIPIYFCYVAPLVVLCALALLGYARPVARAVPALVLAFYIAFAVARVNTSSMYGMGSVYRPYFRTAPLAGARGGIDVPYHQSLAYNAVVPTLLEHARGGYTWASPDCPEIYFLSGLRNPTRTLFDFFDDPADRTARILATLQSHGVTAIVLNRTPGFSPPVAADLASALATRYPSSENVGPFIVRWRE